MHVWMKLLRLFYRILTYYLIGVFVLGLAYIIVPPISTLMLARLLSFNSVEWESVQLHEVSPALLRAVVQAEDGRFCDHYGVDWKSLNQAIEKAADDDGPSHGASTISMQVAKNLFLWPQRSYARKALEIPIALYLDLVWPKSRMMEVYLSIAEWGDGIFGAEAAAQIYFHKSARNLTEREAALLAAALPNPLRRHPDRPASFHAEYANRIQANMNSGADISCLR